jgi:pantothenate kinase type III
MGLKLAIDIGNSFIKGGLFNLKGEMLRMEVAHSVEEIISIFNSENIDFVYLSSVKKNVRT